MEQLTIEGWNVELSEHGSSARRSTRGSECELNFEGSHLEVRVEEGRGYLAQTTTTYIPLEVLARLLQQAGYTVTRGE